METFKNLLLNLLIPVLIIGNKSMIGGGGINVEDHFQTSGFTARSSCNLLF